jgi:hypothetical protein
MRKPKITEHGDYATWISFEVLANFQVRLIFTNDLRKSAKTRINHEPSATADAFCFHEDDTGRSYMFLQLDATESIIVHECWHVISRVFRYCGVKDYDDELTAYHLDHLVEKVFEFKKAIKSSTTKDNNNDRKRRTKSPTASKRRNRG